MKIGDQVCCPAASEKGLGVIVGKQKLFRQTYVEVFFARSGETITFPEGELVVAESPEAVFRKQQFSEASRFLLRLFNLQVQASYTGDSLQTVANFKSHQLLVVSLCWTDVASVLIADEVGLGKTIEAALFIRN